MGPISTPSVLMRPCIADGYPVTPFLRHPSQRPSADTPPLKYRPPTEYNNSD